MTLSLEGSAGEEEPQGPAHWPQEGVTLVSWICVAGFTGCVGELAPWASALQGGRNKNSQGERPVAGLWTERMPFA